MKMEASLDSKTEENWSSIDHSFATYEPIDCATQQKGLLTCNEKTIRMSQLEKLNYKEKVDMTFPVSRSPDDVNFTITDFGAIDYGLETSDCSSDTFQGPDEDIETIISETMEDPCVDSDSPERKECSHGNYILSKWFPHFDPQAQCSAEIQLQLHPRPSSPVFPEIFSPHFIALVSTTPDGDPSLSVETVSADFKPFYNGASFGLKNVVTTIEAFRQHFNLSDQTSQTLIRVLDGFLPQQNLLPTPHSYVYGMKKAFDKETGHNLAFGVFALSRFLERCSSKELVGFSQLLTGAY